MATDTVATLAELRAVVTDAATVSDVLCQEALDFAEQYLNEHCFGDKTNRLSIYVAGHWLAVLGEIGGSGGSPASVTIGSISKSYATVPVNDGLWGSSKWGRLFMMMASMTVCVIGVTGGDLDGGGDGRAGW